MLNKKAPVGAFSGSTGGPFFQKKRVSFCHMIQSDMESNSGDSVAGDILAGGGDGSLLGSAAMTPKTKRVKNNLDCGSPLGFLNYNMDNNDGGPLSPPLDPKIIKSQVEVTVKKSFALDINLLAEIVFTNQWFWGATTPSKFEEIIRSMFTLLESMEKAILLARENNIVVNSNLKRQGIYSNRAIVIKEIPMDTPKEMILIGLWQKAVVEFAELEQAVSLAARWFFLIGKDSVCVTIVVGDHETWASRDQFRALLFTLPVGTIVHDLGDLLERAGRKTCVINQSLETGNRVYCAVVCFDSDEVLESAFCTELILGSVKLLWARLDLVRCKWCGKFGHSALECDTKLAKLYAKKNVPISCSVAFGGKSWAQVVSVASVSHGFRAGSGSGSLPSSDLSLGGVLPPLLVVNFPLSAHLVLLERSVELLFEQISNILSCLDNISLAPLAPSSQLAPSVSPTSVPLVVANSNLDFDMAVDDHFVQPTSFSPGVTGSLLGLSSSKVLTSKVGGLELKLVALDISVGLILAKLNQLCAGLGSSVFTSGLDVGFHGAGVAMFVNNSLVRHVSKFKEVKGRVLSIRLLFKNKLSVSVIGLYACASGGDHFAQASIINSFIADTVNKSFFVVLGGDFNEDNSVKGASLRKCLGLGLNNLRGVSKVLDYILVSDSLISVVVDHNVSSVLEFFDTDHLVVSMSIGLGGLLDACLNSIRKHINKDCWKFKIKDADEKKWAHFKDLSECVLLGSLDRFKIAEDGSDLDGMWGMLADTMTASAEKFFSRHWYSEFDCAKNRLSSKFSRLELLVAKLLKVLRQNDTLGFDHLADTWFKVDPSEASKVFGMVGDGVGSAGLISHLSKIRKQYKKSKYCEFEVAKRSAIKNAIDKHIEKFEMDKGGMIQSILKWPFRKVILDHLVVGDSFILESDEVKLKVDDIMVNWTRKRNALPALSGPWAQQYAPLAYVNDSTFSLVMCDITMCEMSSVISNLSDGKAAGLSDITNELWKHTGCLVLECLLSLLNSCLRFGNVLVHWKETWVSMIPKSYDWDGVLSNT
ncbi:hypothetical protein G9A89_021974 [Geosiphon pyriformis]|nr:hypothetical protein G9A89_021974 [Geosiphon pyriformis]